MAGLHNSFEEQGQRLVTAESLAADRGREIAGLHEGIADLRRTLALKEQEIESLLKSLSWKITKPLRNVYKLLFMR